MTITSAATADAEAEALGWLRDMTEIITFDGGVIVANF